MRRKRGYFTISYPFLLYPPQDGTLGDASFGLKSYVTTIASKVVKFIEINNTTPNNEEEEKEKAKMKVYEIAGWNIVNDRVSGAGALVAWGTWEDIIEKLGGGLSRWLGSESQNLVQKWTDEMGNVHASDPPVNNVDLVKFVKNLQKAGLTGEAKRRAKAGTKFGWSEATTVYQLGYSRGAFSALASLSPFSSLPLPSSQPFSRFSSLITVCVCTSDSRSGALAALERWGILDLIGPSNVLGCTDVSEENAKPNPYPVRHFCKKHGCTPAETVVVGDTVGDTGLGRNAEVGLTVGVLSGSGTADELIRGGADVVLPDVTYVMEWIKQWEGGEGEGKSNLRRKVRAVS